jgi:predicted Zn-dependent protease
MRLPSLCALGVLTVCSAGDAAARTKVLKTQAGSPVHWTRAEIAVALDTSASSRYLDRLEVGLALERAAQAWNRIPASQPRFHFTSEPERDVTIRFCRGQWQGEVVDLGRTQFTASPADGSVTSAMVELNECDHQFTPPDSTAQAPFDLQSVMTHELGHVLGLGHGDNSAAIMFPNGEGAVTRVPHADDVATLALIYVGRAPLADAVSLAAAPAASARRSSTGGADTVVLPSVAPAAAAPADSVSVMNVKADGGRDVMVFTGEPTLLPAITDSRTRKDTGRPAPRRVRANAR